MLTPADARIWSRLIRPARWSIAAISDNATARDEDLSEATSYVQRALIEARAGRPVTPASTEPYGCSIHYAATPQK